MDVDACGAWPGIRSAAPLARPGDRDQRAGGRPTVPVCVLRETRDADPLRNTIGPALDGVCRSSSLRSDTVAAPNTDVRLREHRATRRHPKALELRDGVEED